MSRRSSGEVRRSAGTPEFKGLNLAAIVARRPRAGINTPPATPPRKKSSSERRREAKRQRTDQEPQAELIAAVTPKETVMAPVVAPPSEDSQKRDPSACGWCGGQPSCADDDAAKDCFISNMRRHRHLQIAS